MTLAARLVLWIAVVVCTAAAWSAGSNVADIIAIARGRFPAADWDPSVLQRNSWHELPVLARSDSGLHTLVAGDRTLLLEFTPGCATCARAVSSWADLIGRVDSSVRIFSVSPAPLASQRDYWAGLDARIVFVQIDPAAEDVRVALPVRVLATIAIRRGVVVAATVGVLDRQRSRRILSLLRR